jgi:amino acid transporter
LLSNFSPVLGVIASIPAIMFAFNGFYYPANMTSQMNEPKKLPKIMIIGIILVTIIYILISVSICLCSKSGDIQGLQS